MKSFLFILVACLMVSAVNAQPSGPANRALQEKVHRYLLQKYAGNNFAGIDLNKENEFGDTPVFAAAKKGDVDAILKYAKIAPSGEFLVKIGKNGNNVFHVARDAKTFQMLARVLRDFYPGKYKSKINEMMNQRNDLGETPVQAQINYGRADTFWIAFPHTELYEKIMAVKSKLDKGGLVAEVAGAEAIAIVQMSKDSSGRTIAQAARDNAKVQGMEQVIAFFKENAPYL